MSPQSPSSLTDTFISGKLSKLSISIIPSPTLTLKVSNSSPFSSTPFSLYDSLATFERCVSLVVTLNLSVKILTLIYTTRGFVPVTVLLFALLIRGSESPLDLTSRNFILLSFRVRIMDSASLSMSSHHALISNLSGDFFFCSFLNLN
jgi:hypothetical protein